MDIDVNNVLRAAGRYRNWQTNPKRPRFEGDTKKCLEDTMSDLGEIVVHFVAREMLYRNEEKLSLARALEILQFPKEHNDVIEKMMKKRAEYRAKIGRSYTSLKGSSKSSIDSD